MPIADKLPQQGTLLCDVPGDSASALGLGSSDLCIPYRRVREGGWGYLWGDSWCGPDQSGDYLGSPLILTQDEFDESGSRAVEFTGTVSGDRARQVFDYRHNADNGAGVTEVSRIPNDAIEIGGRTFVQYTAVHTWAGPDSDTDGSAFSGIAWSDDHGATWRDFDHRWAGQALGIDGNPYGMWTFAGIDPDGYLYVFAKRWNGSHRYRRDHGFVQLFRYDPADFFHGNFAAQQNWAHIDGRWGWHATYRYPPTPIFGRGNALGEFSVARIGSTYVMSYFDCVDLSIKTRTADRPDAVWSDERIHVVHDDTRPSAHLGKPRMPTLYGGYIHPGSASPSNLTVMISRWNGTEGSHPYTATQWTGLSA
ncbi:DUF4185 domain-containing protein [Nocardia jinanensis]|uniref:DUF4185 domain-containing protein n=1 Tax=Nocardia jinanensis TaxID=382504 RepID=A0A917RE69_9NOCA|nr:DUF4185 domain-containing protein [Nocardia jinanensis]GGL01647.1 hypothetical protein GCM10011588_15430 [Nocardia jinanensis]